MLYISKSQMGDSHKDWVKTAYVISTGHQQTALPTVC